MKSVLIRADGNEKAGTGHLMRCLAMAEALADKSIPTHLAYHSAPEQILERYHKFAASVHRIEAEPYGERDARATENFARELSCSWIMADGYEFQTRFFEALTTNTLAVDDFGSKNVLPATAITNQSLKADPDWYPGHAQLLLGLQYTLLRQEFSPADSDRTAPEEITRLLITTGGGDDQNVTTGIVDHLMAELGPGIRFDVVVGPANSHADEIQASYADHARVTVLRNVTNMAEVLQQADLIVSSAGSTVWECLALGVPLVTMILAENQNDNATYLSEVRIATTAGSCRDEGFLDSLSQQVRVSVTNPAQAFANADKGRNLIDGKGAFRIIDRLT